MKVAVSLVHDLTQPVARAWSRQPVPVRLLPIALLLTACGGGGPGDNPNGPTSLAPILQVGMQRQYVGTATRSVVYTTPTATSPNNTLVYSFLENQSVQQAVNGAPANFDVHTDYTYSVVTDPGVGTVPISQTVDTFENLLVSGPSQMTTTVAQQTVVASNDETSNALGGGPYTQTTTTRSTFPSARNSFSYPLQAGAQMNVPQSSAQNINFTDVNAGGAAPPNGADVGYTKARDENDDGSFSFQSTYVNGNGETLTQNSDGSGTYTTTTATATTTTTLDLPVAASGVNTLPVTRIAVASGGTTTNTSYTAADWYPNSGAPSSPLILQAENVAGPASLPSQCSGAIVRPNIYEIDTTTTSLSTLNATYSTTTTQSFNANGVTVCSLSLETSYAYDLLTGALTSTTTTQTNTLLNAINY